MKIAEARGTAAQAWCHEDTRHLEMDVRIAEHFAKSLIKATEPDKNHRCPACGCFPIEDRGQEEEE